MIHWDIQWCIEPAGGAERVVSYIADRTIEELREYYADAIPSQLNSLSEALSRINYATGRKFIIIIDEWDVLIRDASADTERIYQLPARSL